MTPEQLALCNEHYERLWPLIKDALDTYGETHSKADVWAMIADGRAQLWPSQNAVMVTTIEEYPSGLKELNGWLGGGNLTEIISCQPSIESFAKENGCTRASIKGRRGWLRAFDNYRDAGTIMIKDLR